MALCSANRLAGAVVVETVFSLAGLTAQFATIRSIPVRLHAIMGFTSSPGRRH